MNRSTVIYAVLVLLILSAGMSCSQKRKSGESPSETGQRTVPDAGEMSAEQVEEPTRSRDVDEAPSYLERGRDVARAEVGSLQTIYFEYDSSDLTGSARAILAQNAQWLKAHPDTTVVLEGHADERGTTEYNQALGQRRAQSARDYLVALGVSAQQLETVSYGEERPAAQGDGESVWRLNRRVEFRAMGS